MSTTTVSDFEASLAPRNAAALLVEARLGVFFVPAFWALDWVVMPAQVWTLLWIRAVPTAFGVALLLLRRLAPDRFERHANPLAFGFSLLVAWSIALMCFLHEGYESPYYAGINLLVLCVGLLFSWRTPMAIAFNLAIYAFYMAPLLLGITSAKSLPVMLSNQFFLFSTAVVTVASHIHRRRLERSEFDAQVAQRHLLAEVQTMATIDWLTNLYNRRHFFRLGEEEIARARRYKHAISVLMIDIDHFKDFNDSCGHLVGDDCLTAVAKTIGHAARRTTDFVARYGGEEFAVIIPDMMPDRLAGFGERVRRAVADMEFLVEGRHVPVTVSVGGGALTPAPADAPEELIRLADGALYRAKHAGRNRVETEVRVNVPS